MLTSQGESLGHTQRLTKYEFIFPLSFLILLSLVHFLWRITCALFLPPGWRAAAGGQALGSIGLGSLWRLGPALHTDGCRHMLTE